MTATPTGAAPDLTDRQVHSLTIPETAEAFRVGRTTAYAAVRSGDWPSIRVGTRIVVPAEGVRQQLGITAA